MWRLPAMRILLAVFPLWCTIAVLVFNIPGRLKVIVGGLAALTLVSPSHGFMALAVVAPFGAAIESMLGILPFRAAETFVMAVLAAWLLRAAGDRPGPHVPRVMSAAGWVLAAAAAASVGALAWRLAAYPGELSQAMSRLTFAYYIFEDRAGFIAAARL